MFESTAKAAEARQALVGAGIDNGRMELLDNRTDLDNWAAFKRHSLPDDDTHLYAEGLRRGHAILVINAPAGEHDRVMQVLARFSPIDIDEHADAVAQDRVVRRASGQGGVGRPPDDANDRAADHGRFDRYPEPGTGHPGV